MGYLDVLFVHPVVTRKGRALHVITPVGLFILASQLQKEGFEAEIINLGVEKLVNQSFSLEKYIRERKPKIVAIDLHWYTHSYVALDTAKRVKECSEALVVMGGYTASYFDVEILRNFPSVDVILRGETELPLIELVKKYLHGEDYAGIPNSTIRKGVDIHRNLITYVPYDLDNFSLDGIDLLKNWKDYLNVRLIWNPAPYAVLDSKAKKSFDLCLSRGCFYQCSYCGGGKEAQTILCGRTKVTFKDPKKVLEDLSLLKEKEIELIRLAYVGHPDDEKYYLSLFGMIQKEKIDISCRISYWNIPSKTILHAVNKSFTSVFVDLSPDTGSEKVRKFNKGPYYSNEQLYKTMKFLEAESIGVDLYFTVGLPKETKDNFKLTVNFAKKLVQEMKNIENVYCFGLTAEPCSPIHRYPEKYGVRVSRKSFLDFYKFWYNVEMNKKVNDILGLSLRDLSENEMVGRIRFFRSNIEACHKNLATTSTGF